MNKYLKELHMKLYTISEAAEFLHINKMTLHNWCTKGIVKFRVFPNGHRRFLEEELLELLKNPETQKNENISS